MSPTRRLARPLLAAAFVAEGVSHLRKPAPYVRKVEAAGMAEPEQLVRVNGATMTAAGLMLATNRLPRLASLLLATSLVPTTYVDHPFWQAADSASKANERGHFVKNVSLLGGLLLAAADTGGRESVPHAAARISRRTARRAARQADRAEKRMSDLAHTAEKRVGKVTQAAEQRIGLG